MGQTNRDQILPEEAEQKLDEILAEYHLTGYDIVRYGLRVISNACLGLAQTRVSLFHITREGIHEELPLKERGFLMCRAYRNKVNNRETLGMSIEWFEQKPIPTKHRRTGQSSVLSTRLPKGKRHSYSRRVVVTKRRKQYEAELFDEFEPMFTPIRQLSELISKAERSVRDVFRAHEKVVNGNTHDSADLD